MTEVKINTIVINENLFKQEPIFYKHGFVISQIYDCIIPYPNNEDPHEDCSAKLLYENYYDLVNPCYDFMKELDESKLNQITCANNVKMIYAMYLASIGEIVFLNCSIKNTKSGAFFIQKDITMLTKNQLLVFSHYLKAFKKFDFCEVMQVPSYIPYQKFEFVGSTLEEYQKVITL